jgi:hypothetical protein
MRFAIAMFTLSFVFKQMSWPGSTLIIVLATLAIITGSIFTNLLYINKLWLRLLTGITIVLSSLSITFIVMHWPLAKLISNSAFVSLCILLVLVRFRLMVFTTFTRNILVVFGVLVICYRFIQTGIPIDINPKYIVAKNEASNIPILTNKDEEMIENIDSLPQEEKNKLRLAIYNRMLSRLQLLEPVKEHALNQVRQEINRIEGFAVDTNLYPTRQLIVQLKSWPLDSTRIEKLNTWYKRAKD